jgi:hypothetical protein
VKKEQIVGAKVFYGDALIPRGSPVGLVGLQISSFRSEILSGNFLCLFASIN